MLTEKENALRVILRNGEPQWVPIGGDCFDMVPPSAILERPKAQSGFDWFGCEWMYDPATHGYAQRFDKGAPVEDVTRWRELVRFPDLDAIDWAGCAERDLARCDRENRLTKIFWESGPFERSHHLLGFEEAFIAMYEEPEAYKELLNALTDFRIDAMGRLIDSYKPDIIMTHDDLGAMRAPLMGTAMYREFIKPCHMRLEQFIRSKGVIVMQHSCGKMDCFVGDMIDCGAQIINSFQGMNDQKAILEQYGDKVAFYGGLDPKYEQPDMSEEELRQEVRRVIDLFAPYRGVILQSHAVRPGVGAILLDEARSYGRDYWARNGLA